MSTKERLRRQEKRLTGGVVINPNASEPVIFVPGEGYQYNGLFYADLKTLDRGEYRVISGPPVSINDFEAWFEEGLTWPGMIHRMVNESGARYQPSE